MRPVRKMSASGLKYACLENKATIRKVVVLGLQGSNFLNLLKSKSCLSCVHRSKALVIKIRYQMPKPWTCSKYTSIRQPILAMVPGLILGRFLINGLLVALRREDDILRKAAPFLLLSRNGSVQGVALN